MRIIYMGDGLWSYGRTFYHFFKMVLLPTKLCTLVFFKPNFKKRVLKFTLLLQHPLLITLSIIRSNK